MSMEVYVFVEKSRLPSVEQWQASLEENGFKITLISDLSITQESGNFQFFIRDLKQVSNFQFHQQKI